MSIVKCGFIVLALHLNFSAKSVYRACCFFFFGTPSIKSCYGAFGRQLQRKSLELPLSVAIFGNKLVECSMLLHWVMRWLWFWSVSLKPWWQTLGASHAKS
ncbi:hypothetical protein [Vibrio mediterranei]|uniref:hypothetical protein n=1 Tax=Vibrio mediterranei TaxID=689 RepID=UPI0011B22B64|nr:hypothetical protein [Vibrio mediterranei]